jgi:hypothetical protein
VPGRPDAFLVPEGINNHGDITGEGGNQGFVLAADGTFTVVNNPFSGLGVHPTDINDQDRVVGSLSPAERTTVGFVYDDGVVTTFGPPEPVGPPPEWDLAGINDAHDIVGNSQAGGSRFLFAFLATPHPMHQHQPPSGCVHWDPLAAQVEANFAQTGLWFA